MRVIKQGLEGLVLKDTKVRNCHVDSDCSISSEMYMYHFHNFYQSSHLLPHLL